MRVKLEAGAEFDFLTRDELREALQDWMVEIKRGVRFVRRTAAGTVDAGGLVTIQDDEMGPAGSITWAVTRLSVYGLAAAESLAVYVNEIAPSAFIGRVLGTTGVLVLDGPALPLVPLDRLIFSGSALTVAARIVVNVQAIELPVQLAWQLV